MEPIAPSLPPSPPPAGFKLVGDGPSDMFTGQNGPLYRAREGDRFVLGMRVERRHCNPGLVCHGGMLMTFVDMAMVMTAHYQAKILRFLPTISLTTDFLAPAPLGAWIEARTDILRQTRNMFFAQCLVTTEGTPVVRASGVFKLGPELKRREPAPG